MSYYYFLGFSGIAAAIMAKYYDITKYYNILKNDILQMKECGHLEVFIEIFKHLFIYIKNKLFPKKRLEHFNKKYLKAPYEYHGKVFYYLFKSKNNSQPIKNIKNESGQDVTDAVLPYLGPHLDCHGACIYPKDFGYVSIKIETMYDQEFVFEEDQEISLS